MHFLRIKGKRLLVIVFWKLQLSSEKQELTEFWSWRRQLLKHTLVEILSALPHTRTAISTAIPKSAIGLEPLGFSKGQEAANLGK